MKDLDKKIFGVDTTNEQVSDTLSNGFKEEGGIWNEEEYTLSFGDTIYDVYRLDCLNFDDLLFYQFIKR